MPSNNEDQDYGADQYPPADAEGLDRPDENEDALDDTAQEFNDPDTTNGNQQDDDSDDESLLSEVDEAQFADFDPTAVQVAPDFETLKSIKVTKRKRADGEEAATKTKEGRREKVKKNRRKRADSDEGFEGGVQIEGKRRRVRGPGEGERRKPVRVEVDDSDLTPEERRRRALDRAMDAAIKKQNTKRVKKGDVVCMPASKVSKS